MSKPKTRKPKKEELELSAWDKAVLESYSYDYDNEGQIVIYTGIYEHRNGKFYAEPDPRW